MKKGKSVIMIKFSVKGVDWNIFFTNEKIYFKK